MLSSFVNPLTVNDGEWPSQQRDPSVGAMLGPDNMDTVLAYKTGNVVYIVFDNIDVSHFFQCNTSQMVWFRANRNLLFLQVV